MNLGERIRNYRKIAGLTQKELATKLGTSQQNLAQYENGIRNPKLETLDKIAKALKIDAWELYEYYPVKTTNENNDYFWSSYLEDKLKQIGYRITHNEEDAAIWIESPEGSLEVTDEDLKELDDSTVSYLQFKLEELKKKNISDFRPRNK